jgi:broad specificity phosphatase PhoE
MKLYFVRHGETQFNAKKMHQHNEVPLSPHGLQQAKFVANRFRDIPIDIILSSDVLRAQQTTEEIAKVVQKQIFYTPLLQERKNPSEIRGKAYDDPDAVKIKDLLQKNSRLEDWHYSDEENFCDIKKRALEFFDYLSLFKEENILAVSHGGMITLIIGLLIFGQEMTYKEHHHIYETLRLSNTGITVCEQIPSGMWRLITWNDHAHLG